MVQRLSRGKKRSQLARMKSATLSKPVGRSMTPGFHATATVRPSRKFSGLRVSK